MFGFRAALQALNKPSLGNFLWILKEANESEVREAMRAACEQRGIEVAI